MPPHAHLTLAIALGVAGQLLFRHGTTQGGGLPGLLHWACLAGCLCYALSTVAYLLALQRIPISVAMPTLASGYILVAIAGWWWWREPFSPMHLLGILCIVAGVGLLHAPQGRIP